MGKSQPCSSCPLYNEIMDYLETTLFILAWCLILAVTAALISFHFARRGKNLRWWGTGSQVLPSIVLGPLLLTLVFRWSGVNLIFPLSFFSSAPELFLRCSVPAFLLCASSGLFASIAFHISTEYPHWRAKPFNLLSLASGRSIDSGLRAILVPKALALALDQCLPWIFGEILIVEAIFNAPGIGLHIWELAKIRDLVGTFWSCAVLLLIYGACASLNHIVHRRIGRRLASYA